MLPFSYQEIHINKQNRTLLILGTSRVSYEIGERNFASIFDQALVVGIATGEIGSFIAASGDMSATFFVPDELKKACQEAAIILDSAHELSALDVRLIGFGENGTFSFC